MNAVAQIMEMRATGAVPLAYVQTYGCQQNVADGEKIKGQLAEMGFAFTENPDEADFILYNTCAVRESVLKKAIRIWILCLALTSFITCRSYYMHF